MIAHNKLLPPDHQDRHPDRVLLEVAGHPMEMTERLAR